MNKKNARTAVSLILSFVICLCLCGVFFSVDLMLGFCNSNNVRESINSCNYSEEAYKDFQDKTDALAKEQKLPDYVFGELVDKEEFCFESGKAIKSSLAGESVFINDDKVATAASKEIKRYLKDQKITVNEELSSAVENTSKTVGSYYRENASFEFGKYFREYQKSILAGIKILLPVCILLVAVLTIVLYRMYHYRHRGLRFAAYSVLGAVLVNAFAAVYMLIGSPFELDEVSDSYGKFTENFVNSCLIPFWITACGGFIIFMILLFVIKRRRQVEE